MLDFIYHITLKLLLKMHFWRENVQDLSLCRQHCYGCHKITVLNFNHKLLID